LWWILVETPEEEGDVCPPPRIAGQGFILGPVSSMSPFDMDLARRRAGFFFDY
jgi:hypothetical protein